MAITSQTQTALGPTTFLVTVTSGLATPTFYWYQDGVLVETSERAERIFEAFDGTLDVQVFDDASTVPDMVHPARVTVQWNPSDFGTARKYIIRQLDAPVYSTETDLGTVYDVGSTPVLSFTTAAFASDMTSPTDVRIKVYPVDAYENEGLPIQFDFNMRGIGGASGSTAITYDNGTDTLTWAAA